MDPREWGREVGSCWGRGYSWVLAHCDEGSGLWG